MKAAWMTIMSWSPLIIIREIEFVFTASNSRTLRLKWLSTLCTVSVVSREWGRSRSTQNIIFKKSKNDNIAPTASSPASVSMLFTVNMLLISLKQCVRDTFPNDNKIEATPFSKRRLTVMRTWHCSYVTCVVMVKTVVIFHDLFTMSFFQNFPLHESTWIIARVSPSWFSVLVIGWVLWEWTSVNLESISQSARS